VAAIPLAVLLTLMIPLTAIAQPTASPVYTAADDEQFAKLLAAVGTWNCKYTPASRVPDVMTVAQRGNWVVFSETGSNPGITFERWNPSQKLYVANTIANDGETFIQTTTSRDPFNATWKTVWPTALPERLNPNITFSMSGYTMTAKYEYLDPNGNPTPGESVCTKA